MSISEKLSGLPFQKGYQPEYYSGIKDWFNDIYRPLLKAKDRYHKLFPLKVFFLNAKIPADLIMEGAIESDENILLTGAGGGVSIRGAAFEIQRITAGKGKLAVIDKSSDSFLNSENIKIKFPSVEMSIADMTSLPFPSDYFDTIIGDLVYSYIDPEFRAGAVKSVARVLKPAGKVFWTVTENNVVELMDLFHQTGLQTEQRQLSSMFLLTPKQRIKNYILVTGIKT